MSTWKRTQALSVMEQLGSPLCQHLVPSWNFPLTRNKKCWSISSIQKRLKKIFFRLEPAPALVPIIGDDINREDLLVRFHLTKSIDQNRLSKCKTIISFFVTCCENFYGQLKKSKPTVERRKKIGSVAFWLETFKTIFVAFDLIVFRIRVTAGKMAKW